MDSHEYARMIEARARFLLQRPVFAAPSYKDGHDRFWYMGEKDAFIAAVRALGPGKKVIDEKNGEVQFRPNGTDSFLVKVSRSEVCTLVAPAVPAKYDCLPLLDTGDEGVLAEAENNPLADPISLDTESASDV